MTRQIIHAPRRSCTVKARIMQTEGEMPGKEGADGAARNMAAPAERPGIAFCAQDTPQDHLYNGETRWCGRIEKIRGREDPCVLYMVGTEKKRRTILCLEGGIAVERWGKFIGMGKNFHALGIISYPGINVIAT